MNSNLKNICLFGFGAAVGSIATYYFTKKHFEEKADLEIAEARSIYEKKVYDLEEHRSSLKGELKGDSEIDEKKDKIERLNNKPDILDYTKFFKGDGNKINVSESLRDAKKVADSEGLSEEELAEMEHPEDDEPYTDEEDNDETLSVEDYKLNGAHKKALQEGKDPYEIDASDYELTCNHYEKIGLMWYSSDEVLANEAEEIVDSDLFVGDTIETSGFDYNDHDVLYVRNDKLMCDFMITKIYTEFRSEN